MREKATSGSSQVPDPLPNTVCVANDIFSGTLDALAYDEVTQFRNGTTLVVDAKNGEVSSLVLCANKHVHVNVGLKTELGYVSVIAVAAYALALTYDRENWIAGWVPDMHVLEESFADCLDVLNDRASEDYADWLVERVSDLLDDWCAHLQDNVRVLIPHVEVDA
jgi:hypothetical protein